MHGGPSKTDSKVVFQTGILRGAWRHFLHLPCMLPNDNTARGIDTPHTAVCYTAHPIRYTSLRDERLDTCTTVVVPSVQFTCSPGSKLLPTMVIVLTRAEKLWKMFTSLAVTTGKIVSARFSSSRNTNPTSLVQHTCRKEKESECSLYFIYGECAVVELTLFLLSMVENGRKEFS